MRVERGRQEENKTRRRTEIQRGRRRRGGDLVQFCGVLSKTCGGRRDTLTSLRPSRQHSFRRKEALRGSSTSESSREKKEGRQSLTLLERETTTEEKVRKRRQWSHPLEQKTREGWGGEQ